MRTLKQTREDRGVTKAAVCKHLGISRPTYNEYEEHPEKMKIETAKSIADFLHVDVHDIFFASNSN